MYFRLIEDILEFLLSKIPKIEFKRIKNRIIKRMCKEQEWFQELMKNHKYEHIIMNSERIASMLRDKGYEELLRNNDTEQNRFIEIMKREQKWC